MSQKMFRIWIDVMPFRLPVYDITALFFTIPSSWGESDTHGHLTAI
jgi:hypothetical protein